MQGCNLFGSFLSSVLIEPFGQFYYVLTMDIIIFLISLAFFVVVKEPKKKVNLEEEISNEEPN